jgi:hypothetical protein
VFSSLAGFFASLGSTAKSALRLKEQYPLEEVLLIGFAESVTNLMLGGSIGFITWLLVSIGLRRMPGDGS